MVTKIFKSIPLLMKLMFLLFLGPREFSLTGQHACKSSSFCLFQKSNIIFFGTSLSHSTAIFLRNVMSSVDLLFSRIQKLEVEEERINICENDVKNTMRSKNLKYKIKLKLMRLKSKRLSQICHLQTLSDKTPTKLKIKNIMQLVILKSLVSGGSGHVYTTNAITFACTNLVPPTNQSSGGAPQADTEIRSRYYLVQSPSLCPGLANPKTFLSPQARRSSFLKIKNQPKEPDGYGFGNGNYSMYNFSLLMGARLINVIISWRFNYGVIYSIVD